MSAAAVSAGPFAAVMKSGLRCPAMQTDRATFDLTIRGVSALAGAATNQDGANIDIVPGANATGGGTDGVLRVLHPDEAASDFVSIEHDASQGLIKTGSGGLQINPSGDINLNPGAARTFIANGTSLRAGQGDWNLDGGDNGGLELGSDNAVAWANVTGAINTKDIGLARNAVGVLRVTDGSTGIGALLNSVLVEANTAVAAGPNVIVATESRTVFTNEGATAENHHDLPTAVAGLEYTFIVQDTDGMQINAATGDTIRNAGTVSASGGLIESATIGNVITLVAINATEWIVTTIVGTWTIT